MLILEFIGMQYQERGVNKGYWNEIVLIPIN
jgi:hypothetical protein